MRHRPAVTPLLAALAAAAPAAAQPAAQAPAPPAAPAAAPPVRQLTAADYARAEQFLAPGVLPLVSGIGVRPTWLADGRFWYRTATADGAAAFVVDPARRTRTPLFEAARLAAALDAVPGTARPRADARRLGGQALEVAPDGGSVVIGMPGRRVRCDLARYTCAPDAASGAARGPASTSPDGRRSVFVRAHNLWARDPAGGAETPLTADGVADFGYATDNAGWTRSDRPVVTWSPDSRRVATFQHDGRGVSDMHLVSTNPGAPRLQSWKYPLPGDSVIFRISRVIVDVDAAGGPRVVRLRMPPDQHRSMVSDHVACDGGTLCDAQWYPDGSHLAFVSTSRDHKSAIVRVADARTGDVRTLFEERMPTQVGDVGLAEQLWRVLPASNELLWWSERDGFGQLYLYDLATGRLKRRVTGGAGTVTDVVRVDERARAVYFTAAGKEAGRDPYFQHLYRVGLDGRGQTLLTPEDAHHVIAASPDGRHLVDTYSTPDTPPVTVLRDADGRAVLPLERGDVSRLRAAGWKPPTPVRVKGRDGRTDVYGLMYTPSTLDSSRKYPIVNHVYPVPNGSVGSRGFSPARGDNQALAELGFVVIELDGLGTATRGKAFSDATYGRMADNTLADQIAGIKELAARHPFLDADRVGIWGHSGGGFAAAAGMFRHPDFYKVGVSQSGNHDNRSYEDDWGERYHGLLTRTAGAGPAAGDNYADEANQTHARNLRGKLLLAHGAMDDNVPPHNTSLVVDALIKAGKDFDLIVFPHARHGYGPDNNYMMRRRWDYFVRHLQGAEPPKEYQIGRPVTVQ